MAEPFGDLPRRRDRRWQAMRVLLGAGLVGLALLRWARVAGGEVGATAMGTGRAGWIGLTEGELALGLWLLSGTARRAAWAAALAAFALLAVWSFALGVAGRPAAARFAGAAVPAWVVLILDVLVIAALAACRPRPTRGGGSYPRVRVAVWAACCLALGIPLAVGMMRKAPGAGAPAGKAVGKAPARKSDVAKARGSAADEGGRIAFPDAAPVVDVSGTKGAYDFGYIPLGEKRYMTFRVASPVAGAMELKRVYSECACIKVVSPPSALPAKGTAAIPVAFIAPKKPIRYNERVVLVPGGQAPMIVLGVKASVGRPLTPEPAVVDVGTLIAGEERDVPITILNHGAQPVRPIYGTSSVPGCVPRVPRAAIAPGGRLAIPVFLRAEGAAGARKATVRIQTDCRTQSSMTAELRYAVSSAYRLSKGRIDLGALRPGERRTVLVEVAAEGKRTDFLRCCEASALEGASVGRPIVRTFAGRALVQCGLTAGGSPGKVTGTLLLTLDGHAQPVEVPVRGRVEAPVAEGASAAKAKEAS